MKWFKNTAKAVVEALNDIFNEKRQADKVIQNLLKQNKKWGSRDRKFVAKVLYDIVRWKRLYEYVTNSDIKTIEGKWNILTAWSKQNSVEIPAWFENTVEHNKINLYQHLSFSIAQSIPDWLNETGYKELEKDFFEKEIQALNREAQVVIRTNTLLISKENLISKLNKKGIQTEVNTDYPEAIFIINRSKLTHLDCYKKGLFEIQDASSQLVAPFTEVKPEMTVIDACAGAGGKTLHLATQMKNKGKILAYDIYQNKIDELLRRARRNRVKIIREASVITPEIINNNREKADILLLDVPCSSLGTLRRKPGLKWELNPDKLLQINTIQKNILNSYANMTKVGGYLIYVTCSILPSENKENVNYFLKQNNNFTFVEDKNIFAHETKGDGFYMAKLKRIK